jgi:hypothetical protein
MSWHNSATGKRGRSPRYSEAAIQFCLTIKGFFNLALSQAMGMAQSLLKLAGLNWQVPDFSAVSHRPSAIGSSILRYQFKRVPQQQDYISWSTERASRCLAKVSGKPRSAAPTTVVNGARFT